MEDKQYAEQHIEKSFDWKLMAYLLRYAKPYGWVFVLCFLLLVVVTIAEISGPFLVKVAIDDVINTEEKVYGVYENYNDATGFTIDQKFYSAVARHYHTADRLIRIVKYDDAYYQLPMSIDISGNYKITISDGQYYIKTATRFQLVERLNNAFVKAIEAQNYINLNQLIILFAIVLVIGFAFNYAQILLLNLTSQKVIYRMREELFRHISFLDLRYFDTNPVGRLVTRVTNDLSNINDMFTSVLLTVVKDSLLLVGILIIMLRINARLTLICLSTFPLVVLATYVFRRNIRPIQRNIKVRLAIINAKLSEYISGMNIIQVFGVEQKFLEDFQASNDDYLEATLDDIHVYGIFRPSMNFIYSIGLIVLLIYGTASVLNYSIQLGVLIAFTRYIKQFYQPIFDFSEKFNIMQSAMASAERMYLIQQTENSVKELPDAQLVKKIKGNISFKNVCFAYQADKQVLKDVSFEIEAGETVAIVGHTGSGKTTITNLIARFYDVTAGEVLIDGINVKDFKKQQLRNYIGMVLQDVFLFSDSVRENIRLYDRDISDKRIIEAAEMVNAKPFIDALDGQFDYVLKERGNEFSAGQRQLLSFARALAYNPSILILDEATSNIDTHTEILIQDAIKKLSQKRTLIVIAHRLSTIVNADKIIVINNGKICEIGKHEALLKNKGLYYDLYRLQYEETATEQVEAQ